jgi:ribokinase
MVVLTLGARGVLVQAKGAAPLRVAAHAVQARDTTGAGDCFVGAFVAACLEGRDVAVAVRFANAAAALSVTRDGAAISYPTREEVNAFLSCVAS